MATKTTVHLETLVTPPYKDTEPKEVMAQLDRMINLYLNETGSMLINVVEYSFTPHEDESISAYARLCVYAPMEDDDDKVIDVETVDVEE